MAAPKGFLIDTHAFLWWLDDSPNLPASVQSEIIGSGQPVFVSVASIWEIAIKYKMGKLPQAKVIINRMEETVHATGFQSLDITTLHACLAGVLPLHHKDPFDRMLIAQALTGPYRLVSNEQLFDAYGVERLW